MTPPNIDLHINRLVLHGFDHIDRAQLGAAVEAELGRLFAEQGAASSLHQQAYTSRLDGGSFILAPDAGAEAIGRHIAQAVYGGLNP
jgi:hypothetical protein